MVISKADLEAYRQALIDLGQEASAYVMDAIADVRDDGRSSMRLAAIDALTDSVGIHGEAAQALAGQLFDEVCAAEGIDAASEIYDGLIDPDLMAGKVTWLCRKLVEGDRATFVERIGDLADFYTKRCNYQAQLRNVAGANMRYARIPTGPDTCDWCLMLASRGFVYYTEGDAAAGSHMHCDCLCVPGRGGDTFNDATQVEGYDPDALYQAWRETGFMEPKNNPRGADGEYHRMVYNRDVTSSEAYANMRRSATRRMRRSSPTRGLTAQETEAFYRRMNEASTLAELEAEYRDVINELTRRGDAVTDADFEDMGNHYAYLLEEYYRKRGKRGKR